MTGPRTFAHGRIEVRHGDCLDHMRGMPHGSVDAVVTDPPYALAFMGREWDRQPSPKAFEAWCEQWAAECLRVVKPGGYLAAFGGTRTYHRLACGIEDAGWYVTDAIGAGLYAWTHGQGFPKGKSQLKPAWEPITIARKPAARVQPLGIDACRTAGQVPVVPQSQFGGSNNNIRTAGRSGEMSVAHDAGRWPTNLVLAHHLECVEVGTREVKTGVAVNRRRTERTPSTVDFTSRHVDPTDVTYGTNGRETIAAFDCHPDCHVAALNEQSAGKRAAKPSGAHRRNNTVTWGGGAQGYEGGGPSASMGFEDAPGGASRFYPTFRYQPKASRSERPQVDGRGHPTVKPLALMAWLVRLVCPPGGTVLDPFAGSGTTLQAARNEGMRAVGIEADEHSVALIAQRLATAAAAEPGLFTTSAS